MTFVTLDYICMLEELYDEYWDECIANNTTPLSQERWYKEVYDNME